jgi:glutathione S-transferase
MSYRLVSFLVCPYVQRAEIVLQEKNIEHETTFIDLKNKPEWFRAISPRGKVPVLLIDEVAVFESSAICELLEETHPEPRLMPADAILRARDRAWFQFAEDLFLPIYKIGTVTEQADFDAAKATLIDRLARLDREMAGRSWLSGDGSRFGMADVAIAPAFSRADVLQEIGAFEVPEELGRVRAWAERLRTRESVRRSMPEGWREDLLGRVKSSGSIAGRRL